MEKKYIEDKQGNKVLPITHIDAVRDSQGNTLASLMGTFEDEVRGLVDTPHENFVTVAATSSTTAATDILPNSGQSADTIYRVSNWDGSANSGAGAYDVTKYSEYAWDDVSDPNKYIFLCTKSAIGEVFDITAYNNNTKYADLTAALGTGGANIPQSLRKGGMSVKFVQSSDNKYVQYRLMSDSFNTTPTNWQGVDDEPTAGSDNLVNSGGSKIYIDSSIATSEYVHAVQPEEQVSLPKFIFHVGSLQGGGDGAPASISTCAYSDFIKIIPGSKLTFNINRTLDKYAVVRVQARSIDNFSHTDGWSLIYVGYDIPTQSITIPSWANYITIGLQIKNTSDDSICQDPLSVYSESLFSISMDSAFSIFGEKKKGYLSHNYIIGSNTDLVTEKCMGFVENRTYKFTLPNINFDVTGDTITTKHSRLMVDAVYKSGYVANKVNVLNTHELLQEYLFSIDKRTNDPIDYLNVKIRATKGVIVNFNIEDITNELYIESYIKTNKFVGKGNTLAKSSNIALIKNRTYQLVLDNPSYDRSELSLVNSQTVFGIESYDSNNTKTTIQNITYGDIQNNPFKKYYEFTVPADSKYIVVVGRANNDIEVLFDIVDTTNYNKLNKFVSTNCFVGNDGEYQSTPIKLMRNRCYRLVLDNPSYDRDNAYIDAGATVFRISSLDSASTTTILHNIAFRDDTGKLNDYYDFVVPNDSDVILISGRANKDVEVDFNIFDITSNAHEQYVDWAINNKTLLIDGTYSTNINNGRVSDKIQIPYGIKSIQLKNVFIQTGIWNTSCPVVAFDSADNVVGYINFAKQNEKYDLTYTLPQNTKYIKVSSGAYPDQYGILPTLYFVGNQEDVISDNIAAYCNYPLSKEVNLAVNQLVRLPRESNMVQLNTLFVMSFMTDIHYDLQNLKRYIAFNKKYSDKIDLQLCGGDMISSYWSDHNYSFSNWLNTDGVNNIILTLGNHDTGETSYQFPSSDKIDVYNRIYAPLISNWSVVQPANAAENGLMYFYKDYTDKGIRLIVLDCMYWTEDENTWLQSVLTDAKNNNLSVIISSHYQPDSLSEFDINVKAFNTRQRYYPTRFLNREAADAVHNYIVNENGSFICWIAGHTHKDYVGTLTIYPEQLCIVVSCASANSGQCLYCDSERVPNTPSQDAFDLIAIDSFNKVIKVLRIGDNMDSWMRSRKTLTIDYINKTVINVE